MSGSAAFQLFGLLSCHWCPCLTVAVCQPWSRIVTPVFTWSWKISWNVTGIRLLMTRQVPFPTVYCMQYTWGQKVKAGVCSSWLKDNPGDTVLTISLYWEVYIACIDTVLTVSLYWEVYIAGIVKTEYRSSQVLGYPHVQQFYTFTLWGAWKFWSSCLATFFRAVW